MNAIDTTCINAIRMLSADAIEKARSGHPGLPMGAAPAAYALWQRVLRHNPANPDWVNRDRFVLSAGHGSMLIYSLLHLTGYDSPTLADIQQFRQWNSATPGHPENFITPGVEVTTGPLGQGFANAVGLAAAQAHLAARFNTDDFPIIDHRVYCLVGDGCLMEGISSEAASLAGHWGLGQLIVLYDDNQISIDGATDLAFTEDVTRRFESFGWQVLQVADGDTDVDGIEAALRAAQQETQRPTLIRVRTTIGYGAGAKAGSADSHGAPLGPEALASARQNLGWSHGPFEIPAEVSQHMNARKAGAEAEAAWQSMFDAYRAQHPDKAAAFLQLISDSFCEGWDSELPTYTAADKPEATRASSGRCLNALAPHLQGLMGGSADLSPSNQTLLKMCGDFQRGTYAHRNLRFGVREHAMGAICNGIALHRTGLIPYCATFLVFVDYMRNAIRMSALSRAGVLFVMTHDSVAVGEDGPTHQPVEHLASLRLIPHLTVIRPADGNETAGAYRAAVVRRNGPTLLALSRQNVPQLDGTSAEGVLRGAYVIHEPQAAPNLLLIGTGAELSLCVQAANVLAETGVHARVVSMPSWEIFEEQDAAYRDTVLPPDGPPRLVVEAGSRFGWDRYLSCGDQMISIDDFGRSGPGEQCLAMFGYTVDNVVDRAKALLGKRTN
ncbi:MAG: transketolase [Myxococcales bacterium]|nr:transketolase [Myxococcales bacterium]